MATEVNMVERMKKENPHVKVEFLTRSLCPTMYIVMKIICWIHSKNYRSIRIAKWLFQIPSERMHASLWSACWL